MTTTTTTTVSTLAVIGEGPDAVTVTCEPNFTGPDDRNVGTRFVVRRSGEVLSADTFAFVPAAFVTADLAMAFALEATGWLHAVAPLHGVV